MSLKYFHIFFIAVSTALAIFFGFWSLDQYYAGESWYLAYALFSFAVGAGLVIYTKGVFKKFKSVGFFMPVLLCLGASKTWACAVCYGDPNSPAAKALTASVLFLLGVIVFVLAGFLALIIHYNKRSKQLLDLGNAHG